jgi:hypothetical protein
VAVYTVDCVRLPDRALIRGRSIQDPIPCIVSGIPACSAGPRGAQRRLGTGGMSGPLTQYSLQQRSAVGHSTALMVWPKGRPIVATGESWRDDRVIGVSAGDIRRRFGTSGRRACNFTTSLPCFSVRLRYEKAPPGAVCKAGLPARVTAAGANSGMLTRSIGRTGVARTESSVRAAHAILCFSGIGRKNCPPSGTLPLRWYGPRGDR